MRLLRFVPLTVIIGTTIYACAESANDDPANLAEAGALNNDGSIAPPPPDGGVPYDAGLTPFDSGLPPFEAGPTEGGPQPEGGSCASYVPCDPEAFGPGTPGSCPFFFVCERTVPQTFQLPDASVDAGDGGDAGKPFEGVCMPIPFPDPGNCGNGFDHCPVPDAGPASDAAVDAGPDTGTVDAGPQYNCLKPAGRCISPEQAACICADHPDACTVD